jgi:hypothetical protein
MSLFWAQRRLLDIQLLRLQMLGIVSWFALWLSPERHIEKYVLR